jgi:hypothetical protein
MSIFNENTHSGSRVVPCGRTDRQTNMTKLIVAFQNITNALKNGILATSKLYKLQGNIICNTQQRSSRLFLSSTVLFHCKLLTRRSLCYLWTCLQLHRQNNLTKHFHTEFSRNYQIDQEVHRRTDRQTDFFFFFFFNGLPWQATYVPQPSRLIVLPALDVPTLATRCPHA